MRGFFTGVLFLIFFLIFPLAVFTFSLNSILQPDYIKNRLNEGKIYAVVSDELPELIRTSTQQENEAAPIEITEELEEFVKKEVTAQYLQNKTEPFIDDTFAWVEGKTDSAPSIDLSDLGKKMEGLEGAYVITEEGGDIFSEPFKFEPENSDQLKQVFQLLRTAPFALSVVSAAALLLIVLLAKGWRSKLRKVSLALFIPTIFGALSMASIYILGNFASETAKKQLESSEFKVLSKPINDILIQIPLDLIVQMFIIYAVALGLSVLLFIISFFIKRKTQNLETGTVITETPKAAT